MVKRLIFLLTLILLLTACSGENEMPNHMVDENGVWTVYPTAPNRVWQWDCQIPITNSTDQEMMITALRTTLYNIDGTVISDNIFEFEDFGEDFAEMFSALTVAAGETVTFSKTVDFVTRMVSADFVFTLEGPDGKTLEVAQKLALSADTSRFPMNLRRYPNSTAKDIGPLHHDADFCVELEEDIFWVPANSIGASRYTNKEIDAMLSLRPEEKQERISTLYEALQLFQISAFPYASDNLVYYEGDIPWEHHKPGYDAVRTNYGCCSSTTSWLMYLLQDDYEELGMIHWFRETGYGHVYNYIKADGQYYILDLTQYTASKNGLPETGEIPADTPLFWGAGIIRTSSLERYAEFFQENVPEPPNLFYTVLPPEPTVPAAGVVSEEDSITLVYDAEALESLRIIYCDSDRITFAEPKEFSIQPDWSVYPDFSFDPQHE